MVSDTILLHLCLFYGCKWQLQKARRIPQSACSLQVIYAYYWNQEFLVENQNECP